MSNDANAFQTFQVSSLIGEGGPIPGALFIIPGALSLVAIDSTPMPQTPMPGSLASNSSYAMRLWFAQPAQQEGAHAEFTFSINPTGGSSPTVPVTRIVVPIPVGVHKVIVSPLIVPAVTVNSTLTIQATVLGTPVPFSTSPQVITIVSGSPTP
jgi:hypothetical protein